MIKTTGMTSAYLNILEIISFNETLFRKEFIKTLSWVSKEDYPIIKDWMVYHQFTDKFPDLFTFLRRYKS